VYIVNSISLCFFNFKSL